MYQHKNNMQSKSNEKHSFEGRKQILLEPLRKEKKMKSKAILKYPGGKWKISDWIISHFPEHRVYLEPFFGSGAVFFRKEPAYIETINDIDDEVVNLFRVCREKPQELATAVNLTPFARREYLSCAEVSSDPIEQARRTLVRYHQSIGTNNSKGNSWKNVQVAGGPRCDTMWNYLPEAICQCCERLKNAQIENTDALRLIERYNSDDVLIYCDPPYLPDVLSTTKAVYGAELSLERHRELLQILKKSKAKVVLSGYDNELYNSELADWETDEIQTNIQQGLLRTEKIWYNFRKQQISLFGVDELEKIR